MSEQNAPGVLGKGFISTDYVTDTLGLTDHGAVEKAAEEVKAARKAATRASANELAFRKAQFKIWESVYGDIQENLGNYYRDLGADKIRTLGLQNQARAQVEATKETERIFAQRGLTGSGLETSELTRIASEGAEQRAEIRFNAPEVAAGRQASFLSLGLGQGLQLQEGVGASLRGQTALFSNQAAQARANEALLRQQNLSATQQIVGGTAGFLLGGPTGAAVGSRVATKPTTPT